jgi:hypothetical protein
VAANYLRTLLAYYISSTTASTAKLARPLTVPYALPFLGHALSFLNTKPGFFWTELVRSYSRTRGAYTLLLGGRRTHVIFSPTAANQIFKTSHLNHHLFNIQVVENAFGLDSTESQRMMDNLRAMEQINSDYLLKSIPPKQPDPSQIFQSLFLSHLSSTFCR